MLHIKNDYIIPLHSILYSKCDRAYGYMLHTDSWLAHFVAVDANAFKAICHFHILYRHTGYTVGNVKNCSTIEVEQLHDIVILPQVPNEGSVPYLARYTCRHWGTNSTDFKHTCALNKEAKIHSRLPHHSKHKWYKG